MIVSPKLRPLLFSRQAVKAPAGFDWEPPVRVYRSGAKFSTSYREDDYRLKATAEIWISPSGNDTTGNGTQGSPYRTMGKAFTIAGGLPDSVVTIYAVAGLYDRRHKWTNTAPTKDFNVIAVGGEALFSSRYEALTWTLHSAGTYTATRSAIDSVRDEKFADSDGIAPALTLAATLVDCENTAGTYFISGSTVYVHRQDGSAPDSQLLIMSSTTSSTAKEDQSYFVSGIVFEGGISGAFYAPTTATTDDIMVFDRCKFRYSPNNGLRVVGVPTVISNACEAYGNLQDGFNYHEGAGNSISPKAVEIDCRGYRNGVNDGTDNDNGSTAHENCRVLRVNGEYFRNIGPNVVDVGTSKSWNLGCQSFDSEAADVQGAAFYSADTTEMWLDSVRGDSGYSVVLAGTSTIYTRNAVLTGSVSGTPLGY